MTASAKNKPTSPQLVFVVGTIAEFIKVMPVMKACEAVGQDYYLIATGQNNLLLSDCFSFLHKTQPDLWLSEQQPHQTPLGLLRWCVKTLLVGRKKMSQLHLPKQAVVIVHGDTVSTVIGAVLGRLTRHRVVHLEAGLRSFDIRNPFPEEINRNIVSRLADVHLAPNDWALQNLKSRSGIKVSSGQNTLCEAVELALTIKPQDRVVTHQTKPYFVFVLHRQENVYNRDLMTKLVKHVTTFNQLTCVFILHHITKTQLIAYDLLDQVKAQKHIELVDRLPFIEMIHLLRNSQFLVTDGGSNQEESSYLGLPCIVLRKKTERIEGLQKNVVLLANQPFSAIRSFFKTHSTFRQPPLKVRTKPSEIVLKTINSLKDT